MIYIIIYFDSRFPPMSIITYQVSKGIISAR